MTNTEVFKALTGDASNLKELADSTITVKEVETVETDKKIAVIKTTDDKC